jgi:hypothetical protein
MGETLVFFAVFSGSMAPWLEAPKGRYSKAQGNALGIGLRDCFALKGRHQRAVPPLQGSDISVKLSQGVALGFQLFAPSGLPQLRQLPTENSEEPILGIAVKSSYQFFLQPVTFFA